MSVAGDAFRILADKLEDLDKLASRWSDETLPINLSGRDQDELRGIDGKARLNFHATGIPRYSRELLRYLSGEDMVMTKVDNENIRNWPFGLNSDFVANRFRERKLDVFLEDWREEHPSTSLSELRQSEMPEHEYLVPRTGFYSSHPPWVERGGVMIAGKELKERFKKLPTPFNLPLETIVDNMVEAMDSFVSYADKRGWKLLPVRPGKSNVFKRMLKLAQQLDEIDAMLKGLQALYPECAGTDQEQFIIEFLHIFLTYLSENQVQTWLPVEEMLGSEPILWYNARINTASGDVELFLDFPFLASQTKGEINKYYDELFEKSDKDVGIEFSGTWDFPRWLTLFQQRLQTMWQHCLSFRLLPKMFPPRPFMKLTPTQGYGVCAAIRLLTTGQQAGVPIASTSWEQHCIRPAPVPSNFHIQTKDHSYSFVSLSQAEEFMRGFISIFAWLKLNPNLYVLGITSTENQEYTAVYSYTSQER